MSFLAPLWFLLAGAAAVPLLVHLLRRRSGARTEFPAARYLLRAEREHSRSLRLQNMLLMLLRVAVVLLAALAAARPMSRWLGAAGTGHSPTALAIVLDNSLSTTVVQAGRPVLDELREAARGALAAATPQDRVWIVTADGQVHGGTPATARAALDAIEPLGGAGDLAAALRRGAAVVEQGSGMARRVALLTDAQRTAWPSAVDVPGDVGVILFRSGGEPPANRSVAHAAVHPARWTPRGALEVRIRAADSVSYRATLQPERGAARTLARGVAAPGEPVTVRAAPSDTGWLAGAVEIDRDELPGDDVRYFAVRVGPAPRVEALPGAGPFVRSALDVLRSDGRVAAGRAIAVAAADELAGGARPALVTAPASAAQLGAANQALARRGIPWRFGAALAHGAAVGDSLLRGVAVRAGHALVATEPSVADTVASVGGLPWVVAGSAGGMPYVLVGSPILPDATDLPVRAAFVPWLALQLGGRLAGGEGDIIHATPGGVVRRPAWADSIRLADGTGRALAGESITAPAVPGVYFLARRGERVGAIVVNAEENESVLDRWSLRELEGRVRAARVEAVAEPAEWVAAVFGAGGMRSLVLPALVATLLLLVVEALVTQGRRPGVA